MLEISNLKIYLIGAMTDLTYEEMNNWRTDIKLLLFNEVVYSKRDSINVINPVDYYNFEKKRHQSEGEVMDYDLSHVKTSDICIANLVGLGNSIGSCIEIYRAWTLDIPVIAFGERELYDKLHPWIKRCITRYEETDVDCITYIRNFYMR